MHRTRSLRLSLTPLRAAAVLVVATASGILAQEPASLGGARLGPEQAMAPSELEAFVDGVVRQAMAADHLAGVTVAVVQDGQPVLTKGYGFADLASGRRVDPDTSLFRIGSITKTFTWIAMMNAVEAGRLGLDDPINSHLPPDQQVPDQGWSEPIRIRHLMTHSAGFEDKVFGHLFESRPDSLRPSSVYMREQRPDRVREPGLVSSYSNYGVLLAGAILEKVERRPWQEVIEGDILVPLGLVHTSVREPYPTREGLPAPMPETLARDLSRGYRWTGTTHQSRGFDYITHFAPAGVMSSSAGDMARYMLMLLNDGALDGVRVFGPQGARAFRTRMTSLAPGVGNWDAGFWETRLPGGFANFGHDGGTLTFFSSLVLAPQLRLGIFVSTNTEGGTRLSDALPARIVEHFYTPPSQLPLPGRPDLTKLTSVYNGRYLVTRRRHSGLEGFLGRFQASPVNVTSDGYLEALGRRYLPTDRTDEFQPIDAPVGALQGLSFVRDGNQATRMQSFLIAFERVGPIFQVPTLAVTAGLAVLAALGTLAGLRLRFRRSLPQTPVQRIAAWVQGSTAVAWIMSAAAAGAFAAAVANDASTVVFVEWPHPSLLVFSMAALIATVLAAIAVLLLPAVWRGRKETPGWPWGRKLRFTLATATFATLGGLLAMWGALQPWNP
jgi:CubicO group peptidase (beta-lactamase class C family)